MSEACSIWLERWAAVFMFFGSFLLLAQWTTKERLEQLETGLKKLLSFKWFTEWYGKTATGTWRLIESKGCLSWLWILLGLALCITLYVIIIFPFGLNSVNFLLKYIESPEIIIIVLATLWLLCLFFICWFCSYFILYIGLYLLGLLLYSVVYLLIFFMGQVATRLATKLKLSSPVLTIGAFCLILGAILQFIATFSR